MLIAGISSAWAQKVVIGNYVFPKDKATYYGELEGGKPHGKGKTTSRIKISTLSYCTLSKSFKTAQRADFLQSCSQFRHRVFTNTKSH